MDRAILEIFLKHMMESDKRCAEEWREKKRQHEEMIARRKQIVKTLYRPYITVVINGHPLRLVLDTGSDFTFLSRESWTIIGSPELKKTDKIIGTCTKSVILIYGELTLDFSVKGDKGEMINGRGICYVTDDDLCGMPWILQLPEMAKAFSRFMICTSMADQADTRGIVETFEDYEDVRVKKEKKTQRKHRKILSSSFGDSSVDGSSSSDDDSDDRNAGRNQRQIGLVKQMSKPYVTVVINGHPIFFPMDTGAECNILSYESWTKIGSPKLEKPHSRPDDGTKAVIPLYGELTLGFSIKDSEGKAVNGRGKCYVADSCDIFGMPWIIQLPEIAEFISSYITRREIVITLDPEEESQETEMGNASASNITRLLSVTFAFLSMIPILCLRSGIMSEM